MKDATKKTISFSVDLTEYEELDQCAKQRAIGGSISDEDLCVIYQNPPPVRFRLKRYSTVLRNRLCAIFVRGLR